MTYANTDSREILDLAREHFIEGRYSEAETLLQQALLQNGRNPEIFQMLATIYYDKGKFNKAVKTFKRALEIDPTYTDASVGLSIILNDIGRYEEGREVFNEAQAILDRNKKKEDPFVDDMIGKKHDELGDLYFDNERYEEALEQFYKAKNLVDEKTPISLKIVKCYQELGNRQRAQKELISIIEEYPHFLEGRLMLGKMYLQEGRTINAVEMWESVILRDPDNSEARRLLQSAEQSRVAENEL